VSAVLINSCRNLLLLKTFLQQLFLQKYGVTLSLNAHNNALLVNKLLFNNEVTNTHHIKMNR